MSAVTAARAAAHMTAMIVSVICMAARAAAHMAAITAAAGCITFAAKRITTAKRMASSKRIAAAAVGIEAVILGVDCDVAAGDIDGQCFDALAALLDQECAICDEDRSVRVDAVVAGRDCDVAAGYFNVPGGVDAVIGRCDLQRPGFHIHVSVFYFVSSYYTFIAAGRRDLRAAYADAVICPDRIGRRRHCDRSAGDDQVVVGRDSMFVLRINCETSASVDRQVIVGVDCSVCPVIKRLFGILGAAGEYILAALCEGEEYFVRLVHPDACIVAAVDLHAV